MEKSISSNESQKEKNNSMNSGSMIRRNSSAVVHSCKVKKQKTKYHLEFKLASVISDNKDFLKVY